MMHDVVTYLMQIHSTKDVAKCYSVNKAKQSWLLDSCILFCKYHKIFIMDF